MAKRTRLELLTQSFNWLRDNLVKEIRGRTHVGNHVDDIVDSSALLTEENTFEQVQKYNNNKHSSYDDRTLTDKEYVDLAIPPAGNTYEVLKTIAGTPNISAWVVNNVIQNADKSSYLNILNDVLTWKSNKTGSDVISEIKDGNGNSRFKIYANSIIEFLNDYYQQGGIEFTGLNEGFKMWGSAGGGAKVLSILDAQNGNIVFSIDRLGKVVYTSDIILPATKYLQLGAYTKLYSPTNNTLIGQYRGDSGAFEMYDINANETHFKLNQAGLSLFKNATASEKLDLLGNFKIEGIIKHVGFTQTEIDAMTPSAGWELYNTTSNNKQYYNGTVWVVL